MTRARSYRSPDAAILDQRDPATVAVDRIHLTDAQHRRLTDLAGGGWRPYVEPIAPYDTLADWALIACRSRTCRITGRGQRWLSRHRARPRP